MFSWVQIIIINCNDFLDLLVSQQPFCGLNCHFALVLGKNVVYFYSWSKILSNTDTGITNTRWWWLMFAGILWSIKITVTGESTRWTLLSSTRISRAFAHRALTSASCIISHLFNCSICLSKSLVSDIVTFKTPRFCNKKIGGNCVNDPSKKTFLYQWHC